MFEVGSTGQAWYDKHVKELQAPDEGGRRASDEVEESRDLPKSSSDVLEPEVVDVRHMELHLPVVEVGTGDLKQRLDEHANALEAPDKRCQCMDNEPADNISGQASGHSMQDRPQVPTKDNQRSRTNSETIANIPDPPNTPTKLPTPQGEAASDERRSVSNLTASRHWDARNEPTKVAPHPKLHLTRLRGWGCTVQLELVGGTAQRLGR
ncbi:hypothetical protein EDD17DRAFT_1652021 [Pisolithus thermaeus]|nr:hypothetical protein EDD17DRAFT_1652021 [Pisolithus thermaeus]